MVMSSLTTSRLKMSSGIMKDIANLFFIFRPETGSGINQDIWDYPGACAYKFLATWFNLHNLWDKPEAYIFPRIQKSYQDQSVQLYFTEPVSKKWYEHQLANMLQRLGLDSSQYSVHSLRAGGATDLSNAGTSITQIQHYGRWDTLTALIYYRV